MFYVISTTYQKCFPENFVKIGFILTLKIGFEKFGKIQFFEKVIKNSDKTAVEKNRCLKTFSELLGPKEKREG
jgi:hypothetical protein